MSDHRITILPETTLNELFDQSARTDNQKSGKAFLIFTPHRIQT